MARQQGPPQQPILRLEFPSDPESLGGNQFKQRVICVASRGQNTLQIGNVQFRLDGILYGSSVMLDVTGRAIKDILNLEGGRTYNIGATLLGSVASVSESRAITRSSPKDIPEELYVNPVKTQNGISLFIRVINAEGNGIHGAKVTVFDGGQIVTPQEHGQGEYVHNAIFAHGEEREMEVVANGIDGSFHRKFTRTW